MKKSSVTIKKIVLMILVLAAAVAAVWTLSRPADNIVDKKDAIPQLGSSPVYVEMHDGVNLIREYQPTTDMLVDALEIVLVNTEGSSDAILEVQITKAMQDEILATGKIGISEINTGVWTPLNLDSNVYLEAGEEYELVFTPKGCNPFFMKVKGYDLDISVGFEVITSKVMTYGDIFYFSIPIAILISTILVFIILFGIDALLTAVKKVNIIEFIAKFGNEAFLIMLFIAIGLDIYATAYVKGVYITADSDGYLREAVNLVAGNGFAYDGMAGYNTWFANWPIVYPLMIAGVMLVSGTNAYLASKIVAIFCVALIEVALYVIYKKKAWIFSLVLVNAGFLGLAYHTWSEVPFVLFMIIFGGALGKILSDKNSRPGMYVLLCISGTLIWMTRYFGIFALVVAGICFAAVAIKWLNNKKKEDFTKLVGLTSSIGISGVLYVLYLVMNKLKNGNPTGVSRGTWWDDYHTLTDDLINSLVTEIFNVFRLEVPKGIAALNTDLKAIFVIMVSILVAVLIHICLNERFDRMPTGTGKKITDLLDRYLNTDCVFVLMALVYYGMFIVIRYRSSMDTFYFRFFAPATMLLCLGIIGLIVNKKDSERQNVYVATFVTVMVVLSICGTVRNTDWNHSKDYYDIATAGWDEIYRDIPEKSVVIWSDLDYRSTWYRPDVVAGDLYESDTIESLSQRYYGSDYLCISREYADVIIDEGEYDNGIKNTISNALTRASESECYVVVTLR